MSAYQNTTDLVTHALDLVDELPMSPVVQVVYELIQALGEKDDSLQLANNTTIKYIHKYEKLARDIADIADIMNANDMEWDIPRTAQERLVVALIGMDWRK